MAYSAVRSKVLECYAIKERVPRGHDASRGPVQKGRLLYSPIGSTEKSNPDSRAPVRRVAFFLETRFRMETMENKEREREKRIDLDIIG